MVNLEIAGTGSYLPEEVIPNSFFAEKPLKAYDFEGNPQLNETGVIVERFLDEESIFKVTGIRERRRAERDQDPAYLGYLASRKAIESSGVDPESLVGIIFATVTQERNFPSAAIRVQEKIGAKNCKIALDIANACAGFTSGLILADSLSLRYPGNYLVIGSECLTRITDYTDINSTLFGDGAGAVVLVSSRDSKGIVGTYSGTNPFDGKSNLIFKDFNGFLRMPDGKFVLKNAVEEMLNSSHQLEDKLHWERTDIYVPHQANARIIEGIRRRVENKGSEVFSNIEKYGNMSSATCPIALDEAIRGGKIKENSKVIIASFGAGLVSSAVAVQF